MTDETIRSGNPGGRSFTVASIARSVSCKRRSENPSERRPVSPMHYPPELKFNQKKKEFEDWVDDFFRRQSGRDFPRQAVHIELKFLTDPKNQAERQWRRVRYMCKGLDPCYRVRGPDGRKVWLAELLQLPPLQPCNEIHCGQRCGGSRDIWLAMERQAGTPVPTAVSKFRAGRWSELYTGWELRQRPLGEMRHFLRSLPI
jgi:hypothetical protein